MELPYNRKVVKACGLSVSYIPSRRTFDRRLKSMSVDIKERIATMGRLFVSEGLVKPYVIAIDSTLLKAYKGHVWHVSSMKEGIMPRSGIDTDAKWGFSNTRGWICGYKLHMVSSTDSSATQYLLLLTSLQPIFQIIKTCFHKVQFQQVPLPIEMKIEPLPSHCSQLH